MGKEMRKALETTFREKIEQFNLRHGSNLKYEQFVNLSKNLNSLDKTSLESLRVYALAEYKDNYKNMLKESLANENIATNPEAIRELVDLMDTSPFYVSDVVEEMSSHVNTITNYSVSVDKDGHYTTEMPFKINYSGIVENIEKRTGKEAKVEMINETAYKQRQAYIKQYEKIHEWIKGLDDFELKSDPSVKNQKNIAMPTYGMMSVEERQEFIAKSIPDEIKANHFRRNVIKGELQENDRYHLEDMAQRCREEIENAVHMHNGRIDTAPQSDKNELIADAGAYIQALMTKRAERGFFGVLLHPFRAHAETLMIDTLTNELARTLGMDANQLKQGLSDNTIEIFDKPLTDATKTLDKPCITNKAESLKKFSELEDFYNQKFKDEYDKDMEEAMEHLPESEKNKYKVISEEKDRKQIEVEAEVRPESQEVEEMISENNEQVVEKEIQANK